MSIFTFYGLQFSVIAYALVSGVFLAFSDFIMRALAKTDGVGGVDAMQSINREVFRWVFMTLFIGMAPVSLAIAAYGGFVVSGSGGILLVLAGMTYVIGCFGVTVVFNVPMNEKLARFDKQETGAKEYWLSTYLPRWTYWNSIRTGASGLAAFLLLVGLTWIIQGP